MKMDSVVRLASLIKRVSVLRSIIAPSLLSKRLPRCSEYLRSVDQSYHLLERFMVVRAYTFLTAPIDVILGLECVFSEVHTQHIRLTKAEIPHVLCGLMEVEAQLLA